MTKQTREIQAQGQDVEAAIESGLMKLGVSRSDVIIEVVDEGSKGLLGIGSRPAVVRLTSLKSAPEKVEEPPTAVAPEPKITSVNQETAVADIADESQVAGEVLGQLLDMMHVDAAIESSLSEPDDLTGRQLPILEIQGDDLGSLIGPRGETLNALQSISRLMVGHKMHQRASFVIDVQGYRQRREQALARLAERMARKVASRQRPLSLEPMPPHERRIIHITLRDSEEVYTQSVGEGRRRKVRILPK